MRSKLVRIGNSRGVRLPKLMIDQAGLADQVELRVREGAIIISPANGPRDGWAEAAQQLRERQEDRLVDDLTPTRFDDDEWQW